jgi:hypothetical protein
MQLNVLVLSGWHPATSTEHLKAPKQPNAMFQRHHFGVPGAKHQQQGSTAAHLVFGASTS